MVKPFDNLWLKIIAVIFGLLLWFHVATEKKYNYQLNLPVAEVILDDNLTLANHPPDSIMITVSATGKQLIRKKWRERGLKIIASQYQPGRQLLTLNTSNAIMSTPVSDLTVEEINSPTTVTLVVDQLAEAEITVVPNILIEADDGFAINPRRIIIPQTIRMIGPRTIISAIKEISTEYRELKGVRDNIEMTLPLALPDIYGISVTPDSVSLSFEVIAVKTRLFENIPVAIINVPPDTQVTSEPAFIDIELTGSPLEIDLLNKNALIATCDYRQMDDSSTAAVKIDCPAMYKVKHTSSDKVKIVLE